MEDQMTISNQTIERCIEECLQCLRWCSQCRAESLNEDPIMMRDCIRLCNECLELCRTCVLLLTSSSAFAHQVCGICSELCKACAAECGKYEGETMRKCAQECRECAATCAEVAQAGQFDELLHETSAFLGNPREDCVGRRLGRLRMGHESLRAGDKRSFRLARCPFLFMLSYAKNVPNS